MCRYHTWRAWDLESKVIEEVHQALTSKIITVKSTNVSPRSTPRKTLDSKSVRAMENLASGIISMQSFRQVIIESKGNTFEIDEGNAPTNTVPDSIDKWHSQDPNISKNMLKTIIDRISVYDDNIEISFIK